MRERILLWLREREAITQAGRYGQAVVVQHPAGVDYVSNDASPDLTLASFAIEIENLVYELVGRETLKKVKS